MVAGSNPARGAITLHPRLSLVVREPPLLSQSLEKPLLPGHHPLTGFVAARRQQSARMTASEGPRYCQRRFGYRLGAPSVLQREGICSGTHHHWAPSRPRSAIRPAYGMLNDEKRSAEIETILFRCEMAFRDFNGNRPRHGQTQRDGNAPSGVNRRHGSWVVR